MNKHQQVIQIQPDVPNPITNLSGYEPTTEYWPKSIRLANAMILASAVHGQSAKTLQEGANHTLNNDIFPGDHTGVEWAELTNALNHVLWLLHGVYEERNIEELTPVLEALTELYYEWRDKALDTLKGDELSTYLRITD